MHSLIRAEHLARLRWLGSWRLLIASAATTASMFGLAVTSLPVNAAFVPLVLITIVLAIGLAAAEPPRLRLVSVNLFAIALAIRSVVVVLCYFAELHEGGPFLGPDSATYFASAVDLAAGGLRLHVPPAVFFGSYNLAHYYLFAVPIRYFGADLFALRILNTGCTALAAPLTFSIARSLQPRVARLSGLIVAVYPSLVALSSVDLLKDPSLAFATLLAVWAIVWLVRARRWPRIAALMLPGLLGLLYLRTGRFYTFAYLEAAAVAAAVVAFRRKTPHRPVGLTCAAALLAMFLAGELLPTAAGWPISPVLFTGQARRALHTPAMFGSSGGLLDRAEIGDQFPGGGTVLRLIANAVRRVLGPFPWILPEQWSMRYLRAGDYFFYPGMLVWYALLPLIVIGFVATARDVWLAVDTRFGVVFVWVFTAVYFLQYLALNLSYRQREVMFPILLLFAGRGLVGAAAIARRRRWYAAYVTVLALFAVAHLTIRAWTGG